VAKEGLPVSLRRTALLALAVILVGGFYYWYEIEGAKRRQAAEEQGRRLAELEAESVSAVSLRRAGLELKAVRREGKWHLTSPLETRADQEAIGRLVSGASEAKRISLIDDKPSDLKPFGLEDPRMLITLDTSNGPWSLAIGTESPTGRGVYARAGPDGPVVLLERDAERAADKELLEFRDRRLFDAALGELTGLRIVRGAEGPIVLERTGEGTWALKEPVEAPADPVAAEDLARALTGAEVQQFIDRPDEDEGVYGLASPRATVALSAGAGRTLGPLQIGKKAGADGEEVAGDGRLYARLGGAGPVLVLEGKLLEALPPDAGALRDRRLLIYEIKDVERIEVASPAETLVVEKGSGGGWSLTSPMEVRADESAVRNFLWDLKALRAEGFLDEADPSRERFGLGAGAWRYSLTVEGLKEPLRLEVGGRAEGGGLYVRASSLKGLVTVEADGTSKIEATSLTLRQRGLLDFQIEEVRRLELQAAGRQAELYKEGDVWRLEEPERRELKSGAATSLFWALKGLKFSGVVEESRKGAPEGEILFEASLWLASGERVKLVALKPEGGKEPLAFGSSKPGLYTVAPKDFGKVEKELGRLLSPQ
jgi:hypothetical protein